jgi:hypothetical protein
LTKRWTAGPCRRHRLADVPPHVLHLAVADEAGVGQRQARGADAEPAHERHLEPRALDQRRGQRVVRARRPAVAAQVEIESKR